MMVGQVITEEKFPQHLYHATLAGSRLVTDRKEKVEAEREGWRVGYRHQEYPKMMYHVVLDPKIVENEAEEQALVEAGWEYSPVAFSEQRVLDAKIKQTEVELKELKKKKAEIKES